MSDLINDFLNAKKQLEKELQDIDAELGRLENRRQQIREAFAAFSTSTDVENVVELTLEQMIVKYVEDHPGCNGTDIRKNVNHGYSENQIKSAITYCSSADMIYNEGSKRYSEWYLVK